MHSQKIVVIGGFAILDIKRPPTEAATLGDNDPICRGTCRNFYFGSNHFGAIFNIEEHVLGHTGHAIRQGQCGATCHQIRATDLLRENSFKHAIVDGQDMVFLGLVHKQRLQSGQFIGELPG